MTDPKQTLVDYLQTLRETLLWKLDGVDEYDARRPLTDTGTNLLGLVKHAAYTELGYFGDVFGRPSGVAHPADRPGGDPNDDLWATAEESRDDVAGLYRQAWAHAADTFDALELDAVGQVPWWGSGGRVTLHHVLVHVVVDTARHCGHADILREQLDGGVGLLPRNDNLPGDDYDWAAHRERLEVAARAAAGPSTDR